jgi:hypothetical protein
MIDPALLALVERITADDREGPRLELRLISGHYVSGVLIPANQWTGDEARHSVLGGAQAVSDYRYLHLREVNTKAENAWRIRLEDITMWRVAP